MPSFILLAIRRSIGMCTLGATSSRSPSIQGQYDVYETNYELLADLLANDLILGWVNGKYEIGPRALGNRSILAAPFHANTRVRLNEIKQREQFRPIAPVCWKKTLRNGLVAITRVRSCCTRIVRKRTR